MHIISPITTEASIFKKLYHIFSSTIIGWKKLNSNIWNPETLNIHQTNCKQYFGCHNLVGVKLLTRQHLGLSQLREHRFKHSFRDTLNPLCSGGKEVKTIILVIIF